MPEQSGSGRFAGAASAVQDQAPGGPRPDGGRAQPLGSAPLASDGVAPRPRRASPEPADADRAPISTICDAYVRAAELGIAEEQAHWLAELILRSPGTTFRVNGALLELSIPGRTPTWIVMSTIRGHMPFGIRSAELDWDLDADQPLEQWGLRRS